MRREFSTKVRLEVFIRCNARCEKCTSRLRPGAYRCDHVITDWMGGEPTLENCQVICRACDLEKTAADQADIAKTKRVQAKHVGASTSRSTFPCGRNSPFKKKLSGEVVRR